MGGRAQNLKGERIMNLKKALKGVISLVITAAIAASSVTPLAYINGSDVENQWASTTVEYGIGDPFIMKYNGMYYLYCSSLDGQLSVRVWSSEDMVNWTFEGDCVPTSDSVITGAYAPEVTYWNGYFYMYTAAPGGDQHRTLVSESPTGPFVRQCDTFTISDDLIDGSVYIDDDEAATKYFLHAGNSCIEYGFLNNNMLSATEGKLQIPGATIINHWTEGPSIFKRGGKYYMTYTGNHVLADNYMVEYAIGDTPTDFKEPTENRILINTEEGITGLGHNSTVVGPDLDSRYIVYHNLVSNTNAPERRLNIDRIVFNGEKLEVQGPTWWETDNPKMPDFYDRMENADNWDMLTFSGTANVANGVMTLSGGSQALSKKTTPEDYTAEFNLRISDWGNSTEAGAIVSYKDDDNYAYAYITPTTNLLHFKTVVNGVESEKTAKLPTEYVYTGSELLKITVKAENGTFDVYSDDRLLITTDANLGAGKIGYLQADCTLKAEYTAFSSTVNGNEDAQSTKPTGSAMDAVHANEASRDFKIGTLSTTNTNPDVSGKGATITSNYIKGMTAGDSITFNINPQETAHYSAEILANATEGTTVSISVDGVLAAENIGLSSLGTFATDAFRDLVIDESASKITLAVEKGTADVYSLKLTKQAEVYSDLLTQKDIDFEWLEGTWSENATTISATNGGTWSSALYGSEYMGDYMISSDITFKGGSDAGLLFRVKYATDSSDANIGIGGCNSPDYRYGYYAYINQSGVHLGKQMFNWKQLKSVSKPISLNKAYNLKVLAYGAYIFVYLDDELVIEYVDTDQPIMSGRVGMRVMNGTADYQNYSIRHAFVSETIINQPALAEGATPINKNTFTVYSGSLGHGYEMKNGGIDFNNGLVGSTKASLNDVEFINGTVSCDIELPGTGGFSVGLLVRAELNDFGDSNDDIDGIGVQLERGASGGILIKVYNWKDKKYTGTLAQKTVANYFTNNQGRTANLSVYVNDDSLDVYLDSEKQISNVDISDYPGSLDRRTIGFRGRFSAHVFLTNYTYSADEIPVDFSQLSASIKAAQSLDADLYTPYSMQAVTEALEKALMVSPDATQAEVNEVQNELQSAVDSLVKKGDKTVLKETISKAKSIDASLYTQNSYKAVDDAVTAAQDTVDNENASQADVDKANSALEEAINELLSNEALTALNELISSAQLLNASAYTQDSYKNVTDAVTAAQNAAADVNATRSTIDKASAALTNAINSLVKVPGSGSTGTVTTTPAVTNGTATVNGKTVLYVNGKQVTGTQIVTVSGKTYAVVGGYVKTGKKQVVKIKSLYYIVNASGVVQKGTKNKLIKVGTKSYVVNKNGVVQRKASGNKLVKVGVKSYIVNTLGVVQKGTKNKLVRIGKKAYVVNKKGVVQKNKKKIKVGKKTYKTNKKGVATLKK